MSCAHFYMHPKENPSCLDHVEIITDKFYFVVAQTPQAFRGAAASGLVLHVDSEALYEPFFADFGPLNAAHTFRFCIRANELLQEAERRKCPVSLVTYNTPHKKANAAVLVGTWLVLFCGLPAAAAYERLRVLEPFQPFRDASCGASQFHLTVKHVIQGVERARDVGFLDWSRANFDLAKYEHYEQVINGDWNWIIPGKFIAVSGPTCQRREPGSISTLGAEDYVPIFKREGVTTIVRLNKPQYDASVFIAAGFKFVDMYFPDGTCPPENILKAFLDLAEQEAGGIVVHCKAGLGRTGTLIGCYLMKHFGFTAEEVIGYIRVVRPGSILGPQQLYLKQKQDQMWAAGNVARTMAGPAIATACSGATSAPNSFFSGMMRNLSIASSRASRDTDSGASTSTLADPSTPSKHSTSSAQNTALASQASLGHTSLAMVTRSRGYPRSASLGASPRTALRAKKEIPSIGGVSTGRTKARAAASLDPAELPAAGKPSVVRTTAANGQPRKILGASGIGGDYGERVLRAFRTMPARR